MQLLKTFAASVIFTYLNIDVESFNPASSSRGIVADHHNRCMSPFYHAISPSPSPPHNHIVKGSIICLHSTLPPFLSSTPSPSNNDGNNKIQIDPLIYRTSKSLRASSWLSWWSQVILTVISSVTFIFARNVMDAQVAATPMELSKVASKFFLPGLGVVASSISIIWTWGQRRLAQRFIRKTTSRVEAANLLRRVIKVGVTLNLIGLLTSVLGAQYIVGTLVAKSMQSFIGFGGGIGAGGIVTPQTLQPLDVLVVQANTNVLSSHFISLACSLWLTRMVDLLDPPSLEDDDAV
eukprot:CAMPEP_0172561008 /NCGR_PEP_ID=MMETSP1067-20121228/91134_1 /TAXON_ID=265564 ORGANISM="Thalassiosira punctigera, Strain Tpunct2005C2" /NCGR_SAMPLE_ID=MMETSP1067 /ASSEMBLY_ACC=CAM_ASM_000444 /LENGTH=292 /DNA_ID=CAMNT_0013350951 /DNA_START=130 /DNA_END=1008 /DNA_ORIENTATION=-